MTGRALADLLGVPFHDTDEAIVRSVGRSIADLFVEDGEAAFRELERVEVTRALAEERGVVALGGGAPVQPGAAELLEGHTVVFLDVGSRTRRGGSASTSPARCSRSTRARPGWR